MIVTHTRARVHPPHTHTHTNAQKQKYILARSFYRSLDAIETAVTSTPAFIHKYILI